MPGHLITYPDLEKVWLRIPKNGSSSIATAAQAAGYRNRKVPVEGIQRLGWPIYAMWRDPFARIESGYFYIKTWKDEPKGVPSFDQPFSRWVEAVCEMTDDERNPHIQTQTSLCMLPNGLWLPTETIMWDFKRWAEIFKTKPIPHTGKSTKHDIAWTWSATKKFLRAFGQDLDHWQTKSIPLLRVTQ